MLLKELEIFILYYFEVSAVSIYLGLALVGVKPGLKKILTMGFLVGFIMFLVRYGYAVMEIPMGSHILFSMLAVTLVSRYIAHAKWGLSVAGMLIAFIVTALNEALFYPVFLGIFNITIEDMISDLWIHVAGGYFGNSLVFLLALVVHITGFTFVKSEQKQNLDFR